MRWSQILIPTLKEAPAEAEAVSHILMMRAGLIRRLSSGVYTYLPFGFMALEKVKKIIREELNAIGAQEVLLPALQPKALWDETGRTQLLGEDMMKVRDRHGADIVLGPTHEEVITDLIRKEVSSYKQLPISIYQIQTKFRDEARPRFGVIRSKEFIMKDAYSFHKDTDSLDEVYENFYNAYINIFKRCGLDVTIIEADSGFMGGDVSHEFLVPAESGEDKVVTCRCGYVAGFERAQAISRIETEKNTTLKDLKELDTPNVSTINDVSKFLEIKPARLVKTLIYKADEAFVAVLVRGDHDVNESKLRKALKSANVSLADAESVQKITSAPVGFAGPVGLKDIRIIADHSVKEMVNFASGANKKDKHIVNINPDRDFSVGGYFDLRYAAKGDLCPKCEKEVRITNAIEVGHVFKLGTKYSKSMNAKFQDIDGQLREFIMGCYGIGVNRIIACAIEQNNDSNGIIWPESIAPFKALVMPLNMEDEKITDAADDIYKQLKKSGVEVLIDDRQETAGSKFKDADLIGIPIRIIIGKSFIKDAKLEVSIRRTAQKRQVEPQHIVMEVKNMLDSGK